MAFLGESFTADDMPQSDRSYDLIPDGWYTATITKAELGMTKAGNGQKIDVRYDITGPSHEGRVVFGNLNIPNPSQKAEEIGRQQLGEIMRAIGLSKVEDTDQLIGGTLQIKVGLSKPQDGYEQRNEVKGFKAVGGSAAPAAAPAASAPAATSAPGGAKPPWAK